MARVLRAAGKHDEAIEAANRAIELFEAKGATFFVDRTRKLIEDWSGESA
jgi:hypothetical protein